MSRLSSTYFFDLNSFEHRALFKEADPVWNALKILKEFFGELNLGKISCDIPPSATLIHPELISIGEGTLIREGTCIEGPCYMGKNCVVRPGAFVRPYVLTGSDCLIGHATEVKHSILLNGAKAPHFNYVGDSILGKNTNLGAGVVCANFRLDQKSVLVYVGDEKFSSNLHKFGSVIGDDSQLGCNTVLNPGVLLRKKSLIRSCTSVLKSNFKMEINSDV